MSQSDERPGKELRPLELLRQGPFRRYIIGSAISDTGTRMQVMAQGWVMSSLTNPGSMAGVSLWISTGAT